MTLHRSFRFSALLTAPVLLAFVFAFAGCAGESNSSKSASDSGSSGLYGSGSYDHSKASAKSDVKDHEGPETLVEIETPYGTMTAKLYNGTPRHRANFIKLAKQGYYDNLLWHRVIQGFMIQGGDPESREAAADAQLGQGGPGYTVPAEIDPRYIHKKGALSAARLGDQVNPNRASSGSQFYIVQGREQTDKTLRGFDQRLNYSGPQKETYYNVGGTPMLDGQYTVFGEVIDGLDIIDKIAAVQTGPRDRPVKDVWMKVRVLDE